MDKEMLAMVTFKEGMFDKFMGWFQSEEGLEIRKTIAHVEQTRPVSYTHLTLPTICSV